MSFVLPTVFGHRGARAVKTENTIEAFAYACQSGVRWVELDAMLSKDGEVMVFHDETLDRMTDGKIKARLDEMNADRLKDVTLKTGVKIPTLAQVLDVLNRYNGCVNIEIKPSRPELARETARRVWRTACDKRFNDPDRLFFSSFAWDSLRETMLFAPQIRRGVLVEDVSGDWRPAAKDVDAYSVNYDADLLTPELIGEIKGGGYHLLTYTVNDAHRAKELRAQGVESFFCDDPVFMSKALK